MPSQITRLTLFKIPDPTNQQQLLEKYQTIQKDALKDGNPYILSVRAGPTINDQRRQGYTVAAVSTFASLEDMRYYDEWCAAHAALKGLARTLHQGVLMVYFEPGIGAVLHED
ncbi:hypothetical protein ACO22_02629 [Paracoccidioides brasiliensis]|uniref:Stress-response A/B barrel domain-containing protein n=1 Tax=Paracoccidioides brasiliensis TaxID=121759 RepID=A0A1D2JI67_PARBR|nr:hypothetical protein ACO22_02629 [Paracoccidioides brasiliensis]